MPVVAVGLSHRSAPLPVLEAVAVAPEDLGKALAGLSLRDNLTEVVLVSTCMRTEVYAVAERFHGAVGDVFDFLASASGLQVDELSGLAYSFYDEACAAHLFRVAAGLDSAVLGEGEVLGQVRDSWERSMVEGRSGPVLNSLFRHAAEVGKRARAETAIARGITSVPQAGVALAAKELGVPLDRSRVVVIGAGSTGSVVASTLAANWDPAEIVVISRAAESAEALCDRLAAEGYARSLPATFADLSARLAGADVVFSATASPGTVVGAADLRQRFQSLSESVPSSSGRTVDVPLVVVDLAVPRDVDPAVASAPSVTLFDIDSVRTFVEGEMSGRAAEVERVQEIVEEEVARFRSVSTARQASPLVSALRSRADELREGELERYRRRLAGLDEAQRSSVEALTRSIVAKLLHEPTVKLKTAAGTPRGERLSESLRDLFDL